MACVCADVGPLGREFALGRCEVCALIRAIFCPAEATFLVAYVAFLAYIANVHAILVVHTKACMAQVASDGQFTGSVGLYFTGDS